MRTRIALLTCSDIDQFVTDDQLLIAQLTKLGWDVSVIVWDHPTAWTQFDFVLVRSTWDYHRRLNKFQAVLKEISQCTRLLNPLEVIEWNCNKRYLLELAELGVRTVPTRIHRLDQLSLSDLQAFGAGPWLIKPTVGANASGAVVITAACDLLRAQSESSNGNSPYLCQPFRSEIFSGEFSVFFVAGEYSHSVSKTPKSGDFRVQEEHGGLIQAIAPPEDLKRTSAELLRKLPFSQTPAYARCDWIRVGAEYELMELELIEPSFYFRCDESAAVRFARALQRYADGR